MPPVNRFDSLLIMVDQGLTKGVILVLCKKRSWQKKRHNFCSKTYTKGLAYPTRSSQIAAHNLHQRHLKLLRVKSALSAAYHPQTDGTTERMNQEIEAYLSIYCASHPDDHPDDWLSSIHLLEFTHNNRRHANRQKTPLVRDVRSGHIKKYSKSSKVGGKDKAIPLKGMHMALGRKSDGAANGSPKGFPLLLHDLQ
jgi:hypothetical protein